MITDHDVEVFFVRLGMRSASLFFKYGFFLKAFYAGWTRWWYIVHSSTGNGSTIENIKKEIGNA